MLQGGGLTSIVDINEGGRRRSCGLRHSFSKFAHRVQSGELVSEHASHHEVVVPTGEEHVIAEATLLDETEPTLKCQRCPGA